jgi:hypothetical protein
MTKKLKPKARKRTASTAQYHDETFRLIMSRFDRVDKDNKDISDSVSAHIKEDLKVHNVVSKHSTYWGLLIGLGTPLVLGVIAWFEGLFGR